MEAGKQDQVICELGLTLSEVKSVRHVFRLWLQQYNVNENSVLRVNITNLLNALEEV